MADDPPPTLTAGSAVGRAIFGAADGLTSLTGVLAGLLAAHATSAAILAVTGGGAVAAAVGMASGDYLGGATPRLAAVMGVATLAGSLIPALPVALLPGPLGIALAGLLVLAIAVAIAEVRAADRGRVHAYAVTSSILLAASALAAAAAIGLGATG